MFLITKPSAALVKRFIASQKELQFSYTEVGATRGELPPGYNHDHHSIVLGKGRPVFQRAVAALRAWKQFDLGWVQIVPQNVSLKIGSVVAVQARTLGIWTLSAARVVYVLNEVEAVSTFGFAYGTLPDHVERGEERFLIEWDQDNDAVTYDILAFSQPRHPLVRIGSPLARSLQKRFARESLMRMRTAVTS